MNVNWFVVMSISLCMWGLLLWWWQPVGTWLIAASVTVAGIGLIVYAVRDLVDSYEEDEDDHEDRSR